MSKTSSIARSLHLTAFVTALALTANILYPWKTLTQTSTAPSSATSPSSGCLSGYPDGTYRGDRPITRNEFAAGLNACLNQVNQFVPINKADLATREDFQVLLDRQIELNRELQQLNEQLGNPPAQK
ncbi:MAG: S-layer homology domain-containing protein [Chroococcidiopsidaceae cyanobacterium CP_BM_RX_35]|nr:S-layer homology domain-containing protein [Chroococcidiopsidaceae cyanobacterium CP_BM_RX_35]